MEIRSLQPFGVEIVGCDLNDATDDDVRRIYDAMESDNGCGVVCLRDQDLTPEALERGLGRFAKHFGALIRYDRWPGQSRGVRGCQHLALLGNYRARRDGEIVEGCKEGEQIGEFKPAFNVVEEWHTDGSFLAAPKSAIALYAPAWLDGALPPVGAATRFASCARGYDALEESERVELGALASVHSWESFMHLLERRDPKRQKITPADAAKKPDVCWPLVRRHPDTGRLSLYLNPKNTRRVTRLPRRGWPAKAGKTVDEGDAMVRRLAERVIETGVYAHAWKKGDLVLWDNRQLLHAASPFDSEKYQRLLFRAEFAGEAVLHGA